MEIFLGWNHVNIFPVVMKRFAFWIFNFSTFLNHLAAILHLMNFETLWMLSNAQNSSTRLQYNNKVAYNSSSAHLRQFCSNWNKVESIFTCGASEFWNSIQRKQYSPSKLWLVWMSDWSGKMRIPLSEIYVTLSVSLWNFGFETEWNPILSYNQVLDLH